MRKIRKIFRILQFATANDIKKNKAIEKICEKSMWRGSISRLGAPRATFSEKEKKPF